MNIDFEKGNGLVPAIIQDQITRQILMLGYMNEEALEATRTSGWVTFFSRSRKTLWTKGETSGNRLKLVSINSDCDHDTLLIQAIPQGPTCHTGSYSCFDGTQPSNLHFLSDLETIIKERQSATPETSYTAKLLSEPMERRAQKVGEEGVEVALAAMSDDPQKLTSEAADLIYHLLVLLRSKDISLENVATELQHRHKK